MKPFQLIFNYARRYTSSLVVTALSMLALVGIQLLIPWVITLLITRITNPGTTLANYNYVTTLSLVVLGAYIVRAGLTFVRTSATTPQPATWARYERTKVNPARTM